MIEKTTAFKVGERFFACIEDAQRAELLEMVSPNDTPTDTECAIVSRILASKDQVINILTMKPTSHARARKANGATRKPRTVKPATLTT